MTNVPRRILIVDDEKDVRCVLKELLTSLNHEVELARDGFEALAKLELNIDLVLLDVMMPGMDGFELARIIRKQSSPHELPIIMVTGRTGREDRIRAVEAGANDFIAKPFDVTELRARTTSLLRMKEAHDALERHKNELEEVVAQRTKALQKALSGMAETQRMLQSAYLETIRHLVFAAEFKDQGTASHIQRMSEFSALLARKIDLPAREVDVILHAAPMHDIGKIGTPEEILLKPAKLSEEEWVLMKQHSEIGARILKNSASELLQKSEIIALSHHEWWNGKGYPRGIAGDEIPLAGRICAVADVFDALTSERPYKRAFSNDEALKILWNGRGVHLDPDLVEVFVDSIEEVEEIQRTVTHNKNNFYSAITSG